MQPIDFNRAARSLPKNSLLRIRRGGGQTVMIVTGLVWITQDGDPRDIFLGEGELLTLDSPHMTIVQALADTRLLVFAPAGATQVVGATSAST